MSTLPTFPPPTPTPISQRFWDGVQQRILGYQRCGSCTGVIFPPRAHCPHCWSGDLSWEESSGQGDVVSYTIVHRPGHPAFVELAPFVLVLVDLNEGFRMLSRVSGCANGLQVGSRVSVVWEESGDWTLPLCRLEPTEGENDD